MYNPFSFIPFIIKKWTDGTRFDIVKMICSAAMFVSCISILQKWNTIPTFKDEVNVTTYRGKHLQNDSLGTNINIVRPYYNFSSLSKNKAKYSIGITGSYKRDTTEFLVKGKDTDSLLTVLKNNVSGFTKDSTTMLFHAKIRMNVANLSMSNTIINNETALSKNGDAHFVKASIEKKDTVWACADIISAFKEDKTFGLGNKAEPLYILPNLASNKMDISIDKFTNWFRMEDISQCYYMFNISSNNYDTKVNSITINFGGAVRFLQIYPVPDVTSYSGFTYHDPKKILTIQGGGLKVFCQLVEAGGLQSVRIYLLSAFATFFLGITLKILLEILWRLCKKKIHK